MKTKSTNKKIVKELILKSRKTKLPKQIDNIIIYTFLYKYCSDNIKDHLALELKNKEVTIDEAYDNKHYQEILSYDILKLYGFHIKNSNAFIEDVINKYYNSPKFLSVFLTIFPKNLILNSEYYNKKYIDFLFKKILLGINIQNINEEEIENIKEIIYLISKLDVFELQFEFSEVFHTISSSRLMHVNSNPEFITQILSKIVLSDKYEIQNIYDPFMKNADTLIQLNGAAEQYYGKEKNSINYLYTIARLFINNFSLNNVFLKQEDATESIDINGAVFDVILSRIPITIKNYHTSNINQNLEIAKRNKSSELKNILLKELELDNDSFTQNIELNQALENLVEKIGFENDSAEEFNGEYEILKDSEFLFLINLIDSLTPDGIMAISIPENFLFKNSLETLRKYLIVEKNYIDTIIRIPNEINNIKPEVIIVFRKNKTDENILFIDMSYDYTVQKTKSPFPFLSRKHLKLSDETLIKMKNVFSKKLKLPKYSNLVTIDEIENNYFNLSVSRYVDTFEGDFISLDELIIEKKDIESTIKDLDSKIDKMMDELNIKF
ncbi:MAG: hypothetical protein E7Z80_00550 [Methanobrevibacter thaueri]|nr:hypothetical protein [Methanobrevibacter thaueri]